MIQSPFATISNNQIYLSESDVLPEEEIDLPRLGKLAEGECKVRELPFVRTLQMPPNEGYGQCLRFDCTAQCDDTTNDDVTNYDGPAPPCCTHVLRDMALIFDKIMCRTLGLEYFSSYGMLLGLVRDDRLIPWTADNDYVVSFAVAEEMYKYRSVFAEEGLTFFFDDYYKLCASPDFMDGSLARRWTTNNLWKKWAYYPDHFPYGDVFMGEVKPDGHFVDERGCAFPVDKMRPVIRKAVYNKSFSVSVPNQFEDVISGTFGMDWRTPDASKAVHGRTLCDSNEKRPKEEVRNKKKSRRWERAWNDVLKDDFYSSALKKVDQIIK
jgi:hypothetical protein